MELHRTRRQATKLVSNESGATAIEYTLIVAMLALTVFGTMQILRDPMNLMFEQISTSFASAR